MQAIDNKSAPPASLHDSPLGNMVVMVFALLAMVFTINCHSAFAQTGKDTDSSPTISDWTAKRLNRVNEHLAKEEYAEAREKLTSLLESFDDEDTYESGLTQQAIAYSYALQENYAKAIGHFELALPGLTASFNQLQKTRFDIAQMYLAEEHYQKAVDILKLWIKDEKNPNPQAHILIGNAYAQLEQYKDAIPHVKKAISLHKEPKESWFQLLLSLHLELEDFKAGVQLLPGMIERFPGTKTYWKQLASLQLHLKQFKKGAASMEIAWQQGLLKKQTDILRLVQLLLLHDYPDKAARVLQSELKNKNIENTAKNWRLLGDAWMMARASEQAIESYLVAGKLTPDDGNIEEQVARLYMDQEDWQQAKQTLKTAIIKGNLKHPGNCHLLLGMVYMELGETQPARSSFLEALSDKRSAKAAQQWLNLINENS